jgi:hypothetical protein
MGGGLGFSKSLLDAKGIVKKCSFWIIFELIPALNSFTCFQMYRRNALLGHLPSNIIVNTETAAKYMAIAAPLLAECSPVWSAETPSFSSPTVVVAS